VTVEGHYVGRLSGVSFEPAQGASLLEEKALRAAAQHAVGPGDRAATGQAGAEPDAAFALSPDGAVLWPASSPACWRAASRSGRACGCWASSARDGAPAGGPAAGGLRRRRGGPPAGRPAQAGGRGRRGQVKGLARGLAFRLVEAGGVIDRAGVRAEVRALSQVERRMLRGLGVRLGAFSHLPAGLLQPEARALTEALARREARTGARDRPARPAAAPPPSPRVLAAFGLRAVRGLAVPVEQLEQLDEPAARRRQAGRRVVLSDEAARALGWSPDEARAILQGPGLRRRDAARRGDTVWRRRFEKEFAVETTARCRRTRRSPPWPPCKGAPAPARRPRRRRKARMLDERGRTPAAPTSGSGAPASSRPARWPPSSSTRAACA
jgi:ATP-dependent RNA helicase SUPV3L1/SUV3